MCVNLFSGGFVDLFLLCIDFPTLGKFMSLLIKSLEFMFVDGEEMNVDTRKSVMPFF